MATRTLTELLVGFARKPWADKRAALRNRFKQAWNVVAPGVVLPVRLPYGGWWLAGNDVCGDRVFAGRFEVHETDFVGDYLSAGMTVLDVGAHHGFYTLLASRRVGPSGRVVAFEPSSRERARLLRHLKLNRCANVRVEPVALGAAEGTAELHRVEGRETGMNSLRPPEAGEPTTVERVPVKVLDALAREQGIGAVDFVKLDCEGAELDVLRGAPALLAARPRPVVLAEVADVRTRPWGYAAREIIELLARAGYRWYRFASDGRLAPLPDDDPLGFNYVAVPEERMDALRRWVAPS